MDAAGPVIEHHAFRVAVVHPARHSRVEIRRERLCRTFVDCIRRPTLIAVNPQARASGWQNECGRNPLERIDEHVHVRLCSSVFVQSERYESKWYQTYDEGNLPPI